MKYIIPAILCAFLVATFTFAQGTGTISQLDQWRRTAAGQITQNIPSSIIRLTGYESSGDCLVTDENGVVSTSSCGTGGGGASSTIVQIGDVTVNTGVPTFDFASGTGLTVTESPTDEFNISVSTSTLASQHLVTNEYDLYIIAGQSNAIGSAGVVASATYAYPGTAKSYYNGTIIDVTNDINPGNGGPWPAFAARYYQLTGRKIAFVHTAVGGTGLTATSSGGGTDNWGDTGYLYASSSQATRDAIVAYRAAGIVPTLKGVLWAHGENDAAYIRALDETPEQYRAALESLIARYRTDFGTSTPFYIFRTGSHVTAPATGYIVVREEQENVATADPNTYIVYRDSIDYVRRGMMADDVHYNQFGYNDMGRIGAEGVVLANTEPHWYSISNALLYNASSSGPVFIGQFGVSTSTWASTTFAVHLGDTRLFGALGDSTGATGTSGQVLSSTASSTRWVDRISTYLGLTDTPSSYTANRIPFTNTGATALTDSADFVFDGTNLGIGTSTPIANIHVDGNTVTRPTMFEDGNLGFATNFNIFNFLDSDDNSTNNYSTWCRHTLITTGADCFARLFDTGRLTLGSTTFDGMLGVYGTSTANLLSLNSNTGTNYVIVTNTGNMGIGTSSPSLKLSVAGDISATGTIYIANGAVGTPSVAVTSDTDTGIYAAGTNSLGFAAGGSGMQWNGSSLTPNSVNRSIGSDANPWQNVYVGRNTSGNWRMSTSSLIAGTLLLTNGGYPSVTLGADTASAIANFQVNGASMGPYTSLGVINDGGNGVMVFDGTNSIGGLSNNLLLKNSNGPSGLQIPMTGGNGNAILRSYNGLGAIFNVLAPYHVSGTEANLSTSIVNSDGTTNTLDVGVQDYGGSYPTGRQMYMHTLASGLTTPMPTWSFGFWQQGYGDTSNSTSSWGWLAASSTGNTLDSTTVVAIGDAWSKGYSKGSGTIDFGPKNVTDYANGATVQVVASSSRTKALEVFSRNGNTLTSLLQVGTTSSNFSTNLAIGTTTAPANLTVYNGRNEASNIMIATPGTTTSQQSVVDMVTKADGQYLGTAGNKGWTLFGRGNGFVSAGEQNDLGLSYWNGASYLSPLWFDSLTGNIGISTTTPSAALTVSGDMRLTGRFADSASSTGAVGSVLTATANGTQWLATSSLGIGGAGGLSSTDIDTSSELATILTDETGTGAAVFGTNPTITTPIISGLATSSVNSSAAAATTTNLVIYDPTNSNAWSTTNPWGCTDWRTADAGMPLKTYWGICQIMTAVNGNNSNMHFMSNVNAEGLTTRMMLSLDGDMSIGTTTEDSKLYVQGSGGNVMSIFTTAGTRLLHMANSGLTTLLGTWDFENATVKEKTYRSFTAPGFSATTTSATTTVELGSAGTSEKWNWMDCRATNSTINFVAKDGSSNLMNAQTASTSVGRINLSTNNTFTAGEQRKVDIGPITNGSLTCTVEVVVNN